jgi:hypothetical protein
MVSLPAVRCDSSTHSSLAPLVALLLTIYAAVIPCFIGFKLRMGHARHALNEPELLKWWGVVYRAFREDTYWWGLAQMLLRLALVTVSVLLWANDLARLGAFSLLLLAGVVLLLLARPNGSNADNGWELLALVALLVLCTSQTMNAPEGWVAALTLGAGCSIATRMVAQRLRRLKADPDAELPREGSRKWNTASVELAMTSGEPGPLQPVSLLRTGSQLANPNVVTSPSAFSEERAREATIVLPESSSAAIDHA